MVIKESSQSLFGNVFLPTDSHFTMNGVAVHRQSVWQEGTVGLLHNTLTESWSYISHHDSANQRCGHRQASHGLCPKKGSRLGALFSGGGAYGENLWPLEQTGTKNSSKTGQEVSKAHSCLCIWG